MAPRGRPRKRLSRMDAATDAMTAFGFDERLVQKTVKQLLKEYGGDDGWSFIEEYGYKELIEAILRDQESNDEDTTKQKVVSSQDEKAEDPSLQSILGPSGTTVGETSCSELVNAVAPIYVELCRNKQDICSTAEGLSEIVSLPEKVESRFAYTLPFSDPTCRITPVEGGGNSWKDVVEGQISTQKEMGNAVCCDGENSKSQVQSGSNSHDFASPPTCSPPCPVNYLKLCSGSHVQSGNSALISTPPPTASLCPVNHLAPPVDHHPTALPSSKGFSSQDESAEDPALLSTTCPSVALVDFTYNGSSNTLGETRCSKLVDAVELTHEELCGNKQDIGSTGDSEIAKAWFDQAAEYWKQAIVLTLEVLCLSPAEGVEHRCKDIQEDQSSIQKRSANVFCSDGGNSGSRGSNFHVTVPPTSSQCPVISVPAPADHIPTTLPSSKRVCLQPPRRPFPCYGWIESDSEEDADDFIQLPPMKCVEFSK